MDSYHGGILNHDSMNKTQIKKAYKAKNMITSFPPSPHVSSTFVQAARLASQRQSGEEQHNANDGSTFGTKEDHHHF